MALEHSEKWKKMIVKVANSIIGSSGFSLVLYSLWMVGFCLREGKSSWFMFACFVTGSCLCVIATLGYLGASSTGGRILLSFYIVLMFMLLTVEVLIGADIILNRHWEKDFPKDKTGLFGDFVKYVEHHCFVFRLIWTLILLSEVASFGLATRLKLSREANRARIDYERLSLLNSQPCFVSKYAEY